MRVLAFAAFSTAALSLAACDSSSTSDVDLPARLNSLEDFVAAVESDSLALASEDMMAAPATLSGGMEIDDEGGEGDRAAIGDMTLEADFDQGTFTGSATNFALYDANDYEHEKDLAGSLSIDGTIDGTGLRGGASGTLTGDEDNAVELLMEGNFYDYEGKLAAYGDMEGTVNGIEDWAGGFAVIAD